MPPVKAILFDGYGTLFTDALETLVAFCGRLVREYRLDISPKEFLKAWDVHFFPLIRNGDFVTLREAHILSLERLFPELGINAPFHHHVEALFATFSRSPAYPDVKPTLAGLASYRTGVVSNADVDHLEAALRRNGLAFPVVVSSESARCYKPEPEIFFDALGRIGCRPQDALYVGDSQEDDIVGARRAGLKIAWLNRRGESLKPDVPEPDHEITTLRQVLDILQ